MNTSTTASNRALECMIDLWSTVAIKLPLCVSALDLDIDLVEKRSRAEGIKFLTVTLPKLGKCLDRSFKTGKLDIPAELGFRLRDSYPVFLRSAWEVLFDKKGNLKWYEWSDNGTYASPAAPNAEYADAALAIRQLTLMFYKLKLPYAADQTDQVLCSFMETESDLACLDIAGSVGLNSPVLTRARRLVCRLLSGFNPLAITPKHGSGASACGTKPWSRYGKPRFWEQIDGVYPYTEWYVSGLEQIADEYPDLFEDADTPFPIAKVVFVPKDSRGPRLISMEPRETMFIQQGQMAKLYEAIEHYPNIRDQLSCVDQERNRILCCFGSQTGSLATIDMKEASDRVSCELVKALFPQNWVDALMATRCPATELPDGTIFPLRKFAPMGSAVCFPVEAICFWALAIAATETECGTLNHLFASSPRRKPHVKVAVFGDDLIVPTSAFEKVTSVLESVGLKVNQDKSYARGPFRESCGLDALAGYSVTPVRFNHPIETDKRRRDERRYSMHRSKDFVNNLVRSYGFSMTRPLSAWYLRTFGHDLDWLSPQSSDTQVRVVPGLYILSEYDRLAKRRYCGKACSMQVWTQIELPVEIDQPLDGWSQFLRGLLLSNPERSIESVSPPRRYQYKWAWINYRS